MKIIALAAAAALAAALAPQTGQARPMPAGHCSTLDDGVAVPPAKGSPEKPLLQPLAMALPAQEPMVGRGPDQALVIDLAISVAADGAVHAPRILCARPQDKAYVEALLQSIAGWRFAPLPLNSGMPLVRATYRIVVSAKPRREQRILLGYSLAA